MQLIEVTPSGTVGKVISTPAKQILIRGLCITPSGANVTVKFRATSASTQLFFARCLSAQGSKDILFREPVRYDEGLHVTVIGAVGAAYLYTD